MLQQTSYKVDKKIVKKVAELEATGKVSLNEPTGDFFYDPWQIKPQYQGSVIEEVLNTLPFPIGEARIIALESGRCYFSHSDIDDRYHLNLSGDCAALINLENEQLHFLTPDGIWYDMDAGPRHSAVNFGQYSRKQLVVRKLLKRNIIDDFLEIKVTIKGENARFVFDNTISPWLNRANKNEIIDKFKVEDSSVCFRIDKMYIEEFKKIIPKQFDYEYK